MGSGMTVYCGHQLCMTECSVMQSDAFLQELHARTVRARAGASAGWFPMLLTGLAMLAAFPALAGWYDAFGCSPCDFKEAGAVDSALISLGGGSTALGLHWLVAVPLVQALTWLWYARTRRVGLRQRWGPQVAWAAGALFVLLFVALPPLAQLLPAVPAPGLTPLLALALGLAVLARVEHDSALAVGAAAVAGVAVLMATLAGHVTTLSDSAAGSVGQALLAPSVQLAATGLALVLGSVPLRAARRRGAARPVASLAGDVPWPERP